MFNFLSKYLIVDRKSQQLFIIKNKFTHKLSHDFIEFNTASNGKRISIKFTYFDHEDNIRAKDVRDSYIKEFIQLLESRLNEENINYNFTQNIKNNMTKISLTFNVKYIDDIVMILNNLQVDDIYKIIEINKYANKFNL